MPVRRFQDLTAWRLANECKLRVYALVDGSTARSDQRFADQIRAAAASAPANLAEGFGFFRHPEFAKHARFAKASLMETQNHLADGVDRRFWSKEDVQTACELADRAIGACVRLLAHLETTDAPGTTKRLAPRTGTTFPKRER